MTEIIHTGATTKRNTCLVNYRNPAIIALLEVDGKKLKSNTQLEDILFEKEIGDSVELSIDRFGESKTINLVVEEIPPGVLE